MGIRLWRENDRFSWDEYVLGSDISTCYHLSAWKDVIEKSFGHMTYYLLSENSRGRINGIFPLVHLRSILFGNFMVSLPYFNYGGICADNKKILDRLLSEAVGLGESLNTEHIELRHTHPMDNGLSIKTSKVSMRLMLPNREDLLWKGFSSKLRSQIRRPLKEAMYTKIGGFGEINDFYDVFSVNMRDLGTPVYSKGFFKDIFEKFPESTWICTVYTKKGYPVASALLFGFKNNLEIPWASSLRAYNKYSPNMLLYWRSLEFACKKGYKVFDFGRSTFGEGAFRFKEQWGASPLQLYWEYWLKKEGPLPEVNPKNPKYKMAIKLWQKLPLFVSNLFGPSIVKNIP